MAEVSSNWKPGDWGGRPRWICRQNFLKRTHILPIPSKPYSVHFVHSARNRMKGMIFRSFRKRNISQKNTNTVYSEYSGIVPKEHAQNINRDGHAMQLCCARCCVRCCIRCCLVWPDLVAYTNTRVSFGEFRHLCTQSAGNS